MAHSWLKVVVPPAGRDRPQACKTESIYPETDIRLDWDQDVIVLQLREVKNGAGEHCPTGTRTVTIFIRAAMTTLKTPLRQDC